MRPIDSETGTPWSAEGSNLKLQEIRAGVIQELCARDMQNGVPEDGKVYTETVIEPKEGERGRPQYIVRIDPRLVAVKHKGEETKRLVRARWASFCSEPRNEKDEVKDAQLSARFAEIKEAQRKADEYVDPSLGTISAPFNAYTGPDEGSKPEAEKPKRQAGKNG